MTSTLITTTRELDELCRQLSEAETIAFDTEFVGEHTYRPQLCLVQVAAGGRLAAIDPLAIDDLAPFWQLLVEEGREIVVHAGREEMVFCLEALGQQPRRLFDVQIAAGLVGLDYPAGYGSLTSRLLGKTAHKGETRTDWRRRPLSQRQIDYALEDVRYLVPMRNKLARRLEALGRTAWLETEIADWQAEIAESLTRERWRKVTGSSSLSGRSLAIVRELWRWREAAARHRNVPARKVLRDDLIVELAKRRSADPQQIRALRGFERRDLRVLVPELAEAIRQGLEMDEEEMPPSNRQESSPQLTMLGQFLSSALGSICRQAEVASSLVGSANDVRELVAYRLDPHRRGPPPALTVGWRAEVVGHVIDDLLAGKLAIRIDDPRSEDPLAFEPLEPRPRRPKSRSGE